MNNPTTKAAFAGESRESLIHRIELLTADLDAEQRRPQPDTASRELREALAQIREITRPFSMTMSGPQWMSGDTDIFRGGNREKVWRIADAALAATEGTRDE